MGLSMFRNGRELLPPGNIDWEPCNDDREADMGLLGEVVVEGGLAMTEAFIRAELDKTDCADEKVEVR